VAEEATEAYERTRKVVADFVGVGDESQVIFTRNTTESINLIAMSWGRSTIKKGDKILLTMLEHHSNIVPWQMLAKEVGAKLEYASLKEDGTLDLDDFREKVKGARLFSFAHVSNVLGTINPAKYLIDIAKSEGATVVVDGAQSCPHMRVNIGELGCDFYAFSAHKMLGPTGVGVLYGKRNILEEMPPFMTGGDMISQVHRESASWNILPWKYEAGTSNIADVAAFSEAIKYLSTVGMERIMRHEEELTRHCLEALGELPGITIYGSKDVRVRSGIVPFNIVGIHPHDVASILSSEGVAVRSGNHCAQPLHESLSLDATVRASFYLYNSVDDIDRLVDGVKKAIRVMAK
jgi:cysteine desulfurase/selenocysteine lyase